MAKNRQMLISTKQAAERLREHPRSVQRKAESGEYPASKLPGLRGAYVFTERDIQSILLKQKLDAERRAEAAEQAAAKAARAAERAAAKAAKAAEAVSS